MIDNTTAEPEQVAPATSTYWPFESSASWRRFPRRLVLAVGVILLLIAGGTFAFQATRLHYEDRAKDVFFLAGQARSYGDDLRVLAIIDGAEKQWWFRPDVEHLMARGDACARLGRGNEAIATFNRALATIDDPPFLELWEHGNTNHGNMDRVVISLRIALVESGVVGPDYSLRRVEDAQNQYARNSAPPKKQPGISAASL